MSIIIAWKTEDYIYMGADSLISDGTTKWTCKEPKIFLAGGQYIVGSVGYVRFGQLLQHVFEWPTLPEIILDVPKFMVVTFIPALRKMLKEQGYEKEKDNVAKIGEGAIAIIGVRGSLFRLYDDYQIAEYDAEFEAIGRGDDMAMGAYEVLGNMNSGDVESDMHHILEIVGKHMVGIREPYCILKQAN